MRGPSILVEHLAAAGYHPRSDAHSNAICKGILEDLLDQCEPIAERAASGRLVAKPNHTVIVSYQEWKSDLAIGPPPDRPTPPANGQRIRIATPALVEIAIEAKGVMTEHGKARLNRLRDLQAFHHHAHAYNDKVIAVGIVVVNVAETFWSPTRNATDITHHTNIQAIGGKTVETYRNLPLRNQPTDGPGLEAAAVIVVEHDNLRKNPLIEQTDYTPGASRLVTVPPAPPLGSPLNYSTMIQRVCTAYRDRWT